MKRIEFCGSIIGSVTLRKGETEEDAVRRAEITLLDLFGRSARNLGIPGTSDGPNINLEVVETEEWED
jgi:hypothetical protein